MNENRQMVYIGPSLSGARLMHATVFCGAYPPYIKEIMDNHPWFKNLFVPVETYAESMKMLRSKGTALHIFAERCKEV